MTQEPQEEDAALVRRSLAGDDVAFSALVRRHQQALFSFAARYVGSSDAALDVVQESFVAAWKALKRYDQTRSFGVWLRAIALNKCRDCGRRLAVRRFLLGDAGMHSAEFARYADPSVSAEEMLLIAERCRSLEVAVARLPPALKEPFLLTQFEELSQQQAADILNISVKAVEMRVYRARKQLANSLRLNGA